MLKVVLDTNIIVSAAISKQGNPAKIMEMVFDEVIQPYYNDAVLFEYAEVLARPHFKLTSDEQALFIEGITRAGELIEESAASTVSMTDETDRKFYNLAKTVNAFLVTGNARHFPNESFIISPADFIKQAVTVSKIELVTPAIEHRQAAWEYRQEHIDFGETRIHGSSGFIRADNYESWLEKITWNQTRSTPDWVTGSVYFAFVGSRLVGTVAVRHKLNDELLKGGGHIGYGVRPSERRKGYATQMLALALEKCREFGIDKALITCDKDNIASAKTITKNGGVLDSEIINESGNIVQRYWVSM